MRTGCGVDELNQDGDSSAYRSFVGDQTDVLGLLSFAIYKQTEQDFIREVQRRGGAGPDEAALRAFREANLLDGHLSRYRAAASELLQAYTASRVERVRETLRAEVAAAELGSALERAARAGALHRQVAAGILAAFAYTLLLIAFALVLRYAGIDLSSVLRSVGH